MKLDHPFTFDRFVLDSQDARLFRDGEPVALTPKSFAVLCHLAANAGRLVSKEELLRAVWEDVCVGDGSLKVCVREIRQALGDEAQSPRFVETVHRRGYRFIGRPNVAAVAPSRTAAVTPPIALVSETPEMVGRSEELQRLAVLFAAAKRGERQVAFVTGEPGSGKTTLVNAFARTAVQAGAWVAVGQCFEQFGAGEAYRPVLEAIGQLCRDPRYTPLLSLLGRHAPTWVVQMPWIGDAVGLGASSREVLGATAERMLREACDVLEALTSDTTLVLILEDLHWGDYATVDLVSALARRGRPARLLLIVTYRPVEAILSVHPIKAIKQEMLARRICHELPLEGLDESAVAEYLACRFPGESLPDDLLQWLLRRTAGNPLFLVNLIDDWELQGALDHAEGRWRLRDGPSAVEGVPESVRTLIEKRVERLGDEDQRVLEAASVAGSEFAAAAVAAALDIDEMEVEECCEGLARRHLILQGMGEVAWPDGTVSGRYRFLHELYRDVIYGRLPTARRARLHQRLGERLEAAHGDGAAAIAAELAAHFEQGRDVARAVQYLEQAACNVARRYANREAIAYLDRALTLTDRLPSHAQLPTRLALFERRGLVRRASNDLAGAATDFKALADCAHDLGRIEKELDARFYLASAVSWSDRERCLAASDQAIACVSQLNDALSRAHTRGRAAYWNLLWRDWSTDDAAAIAEATEAARRTGDRAMLAQHVIRHVHFLCFAARYEEACEIAREAAQLALELGDASEYLLCHFFWAWALLHAGRWGEMLETLEAGTNTADRNGHRRWSLLLRLERAWLHEQALDFEGALSLCDGVVEEAGGLGLGYAESFGLILRGFARLGLRQVAEALHDFERIGSLLEEKPRILGWVWRLPLHLGLSECRLLQGAFPHARQEAERLCALAARSGERTYMARAHRVLAEVALIESNRKGLETALEEMLATVIEENVPLASWRVNATAARLSQKLRRQAAANIARERSEAAVRALAGSLGHGHPLGDTMLNRSAKLHMLS